jgi:predicted ATPase
MVATSGGSILSKLEISKKIVGRDDEIERLQNIYCKIRDEVPTQTKPHSRYATGMSTRSQSVFVEGVSGIGKSALVKTAFAEMVEMDDHGYYVEGKFDLRNSHLPFSAIAAALVSLCSKVLRSDDGDKDEVTSLRQKIKDTFDDDDQAVLGGLLPNLIVADDVEICTPARSNNNSDGHHSMKNTFFRLKKLVVSLVKILVGDRVLTMFIDDLQVSSKFKK